MLEIINTNGMDLHLEEKNEKLLSIKDVEKSIYIKSGYYKIRSTKKLDSESFVEQCGLTLTEEGIELFQEYKKIFSD